MSTSIDFVDNPRMPMMTPEQYNSYNEYQKSLMQNGTPQTRPLPPQEKLAPAPKKPLFATKESVSNSGTDVSLNDANTIKKTKERVSGKRKKAIVEEGNTIVNVDDNTSVEETSTINSYAQTTSALGYTLGQIDQVTSELKEEFDNVRLSKNLKGKYTYLVGLSNSLSQLINTKANVLREINNSITKSNELDYKKAKDLRDAQSASHDDKYIMDLYQSFIMNPQEQADKLNQLGPGLNMVTSPGNNIGMAPIVNAEPTNVAAAVDTSGYLNYMNQTSEDHNMMYYSSDPNTQTVITYDAATGEKHFKLMNSITGQIIESVKPMDDRFLEDVTIDLNKRIGKNANLRQVYPLVIYNDNISNNY